LSDHANINFQYREDIDWPFLLYTLEFLKDIYIRKKPIIKMMTLLRLLVDKKVENPLTDYTLMVIEK